MHLAIESLGSIRAGGATVLLDFLSTALEDERIEKVTVFTGGNQRREFGFPPSPKLVVSPHPWADRSYVLRALWYVMGLRLECHRREIDGLVCLNGMGQVGSIPQVTFLQQSLPFEPEAIRTLSVRESLQMRIIRLMTRSSTKTADVVITQTPAMRRSVRQYFKLEKSDVKSIIPTTKLPDPSQPPDNQIEKIKNVPEGKRILYVGNDNEYKNIDVLNRAVSKVCDSHEQVKLFLAGPDKHEGSPPHVSYLGFVPRNRLRNVYQAADVFVIPSLVESCPLPMLEAMSCGLPVVAADKPYAHSVGSNAIKLFDPNNPTDLAETLETLIERPDVRKRLSEKSYKRFEYLDQRNPYERMVEKVVKVIS